MDNLLKIGCDIYIFCSVFLYLENVEPQSDRHWTRSQMQSKDGSLSFVNVSNPYYVCYDATILLWYSLTISEQTRHLSSLSI